MVKGSGAVDNIIKAGDDLLAALAKSADDAAAYAKSLSNQYAAQFVKLNEAVSNKANAAIVNAYRTALETISAKAAVAAEKAASARRLYENTLTNSQTGIKTITNAVEDTSSSVDTVVRTATGAAELLTRQLDDQAKEITNLKSQLDTVTGESRSAIQRSIQVAEEAVSKLDDAKKEIDRLKDAAKQSQKNLDEGLGALRQAREQADEAINLANSLRKTADDAAAELKNAREALQEATENLAKNVDDAGLKTAKQTASTALDAAENAAKKADEAAEAADKVVKSKTTSWSTWVKRVVVLGAIATGAYFALLKPLLEYLNKDGRKFNIISIKNSENRNNVIVELESGEDFYEKDTVSFSETNCLPPFISEKKYTISKIISKTKLEVLKGDILGTNGTQGQMTLHTSYQNQQELQRDKIQEGLDAAAGSVKDTIFDAFKNIVNKIWTTVKDIFKQIQGPFLIFVLVVLVLVTIPILIKIFKIFKSAVPKTNK